MAPFTVVMRTFRPPAPSVPWRCLPSFPVTTSG